MVTQASVVFRLPDFQLVEGAPAQQGTEYFLNLSQAQIKAIREEQWRLMLLRAPLEETLVGAIAMKLSNNPWADRGLWPQPINQIDVNRALLARRRAMAGAAAI
jgi:hypothetical protein